MEKRNSKDIYIHSFSSFFFYSKKKKLWRVNDLLFYSFLFPFFWWIIREIIYSKTNLHNFFHTYITFFKLYYIYYIFGPILIFLEVSKDFNHDFLLTFLDGYMKLKDTKKIKKFRLFADGHRQKYIYLK